MTVVPVVSREFVCQSCVQNAGDSQIQLMKSPIYCVDKWLP